MAAEFSRSKLQPDKIEFVDDKAAFYVAMDEIIKHNCYSNEFNYM